MSLTRWEATKEWSKKKWKNTKEWTLEKSKTKAARWTISIFSGVSIASVVYNLIPTTGGWLAVNIALSITTFGITARVTSHQLSSQHEAPENAKKIAKITAKEMLQEIVNQQNENIARQNHNNQFILHQLNLLRARNGADSSKLSAAPHHDSALEEDSSDALPSSASSEEMLMLVPLCISLSPDELEEKLEENNHTLTNIRKVCSRTLSRCWENIGSRRRWGLFGGSEETELVQTQAQASYQSNADYPPVDPIQGTLSEHIIISEYQQAPNGPSMV